MYREEVTYEGFEKYPTSTEFSKFMQDPEKRKTLIIPREEPESTGYDKLLYGQENFYFIESESRFKENLKKYYNMDLQQANIISAAEIVDWESQFFTKNSPWTPIFSTGFKKLEEQGIVEQIYEKQKEDFVFTNDQEGMPLNKVSLLFISLLIFFAVSFILFLFEWIFYGTKVGERF